MNRSELVAAVAEAAGLTTSQADAALKALASVVGDAVARREKVQIPGFVAFEAVHRAARTGLNPRTGEPLEVPAGWAVKVTAGSALKSAAAGG